MRNWTELGRAADPPGGLLARLLAAWEESHRAYHTNQHLLECLDLAEEHRDIAARPAEVAMALWFHDVVYDPTRHDNEALSAIRAEQDLTAEGLEPAAVARIVHLILSTDHARDDRELTGDAALVHDIDLAILGAAPERFAEYQEQVRREYAWVLHSVFRAERKAVLTSFLERPRIYRSEAFGQHCERRARENLTAAVAGPG